MSQERYTFNLYWSSRRENARQCAMRFARTVDGLNEFDPIFSRWRKVSRSNSMVETPFFKLPADLEELTAIFSANQRFYDFPPTKPWPELGYSVAVANGADGPETTVMMIQAGSYSQPRRANSLYVRMGRSPLKTGRSWQAADFREIMRLLIDAWNPDEAMVDCARYEQNSPQNEMGKWPMPLVGWLTYLTVEQFPKVKPPAGVQVERLANGGAILTLCEEPFTIDNPGHMKLAAALSAAMRPIQAYP